MLAGRALLYSISLLSVLCQSALASEYGTVLPLFANPDNSKYLTPFDIGNDTVYLNLDTASSDSWLRTPNTICVSGFSAVPCQAPAGLAYSGPSSCTNMTSSITYADGTFVQGFTHNVWMDIGCNTSFPISIEMLFANYTSVANLSPAMGYLGLGYSGSISSANTTEASNMFSDKCVANAWSSGSSFMDNLFTWSSMLPFFGLAVSRKTCNDSSKGLLSFGVHLTPNIPVINTTSLTADGLPGYAETAIVPTAFKSATPQYEFYAIEAQIQSDFSVSTPQIFIIDAANPVSYLNDSVAVAQMAQSYDPPGWQLNNSNVWFVDCDATPPSTIVAIQGAKFSINAVDMVYRIGEGCISAFQSWPLDELTAWDPPQYNSLGQPFLKNSYVEFWRGNETEGNEDRLRIWSRPLYDC